jgi:hypothetical protein
MYLLCAVYSCRNFGQAAVPLKGIHLVCRSNTAGLEGCRVHRLLLWLSVHSKHDGRCPVVPDHIVVIWVQMVLTPRPAASVLHRGPARPLLWTLALAMECYQKQDTDLHLLFRLSRSRPFRELRTASIL